MHGITDKQDTITRNKVKCQRMILIDTMLNLHTAFLHQHEDVRLSYSSFCALCPFYITPPRASDRKACQCLYHENAKMMLEVLKSHSIVSTAKLEDSFYLVCCSPASESCLFRTCSRCRNKQTGLPAEKGTIQVEWEQWKRIEEQTDDGVHFNTKLVRHFGTLSELLILYQGKLKNDSPYGHVPH